MRRNPIDAREYAARLNERLTRDRAQVEQLDQIERDDGLTDGQRQRRDQLSNSIRQTEQKLDEVNDERESFVRDGLASGRIAVEGSPQPGDQSGTRMPLDPSGQPDRARPARDTAFRTIEMYVDSGHLRSDAADHLDQLVSRRDPLGIDSRYLAAVGDPDYARAFAKVLADPAMGHLRMSPEEVRAWQTTVQVEAQRGLISGIGAQGGFAIPFTIDPSILLTSSGALNPVRTVARVFPVATREWRGVSSAGVTASYDPEATEVSDDTPVLAQPTIVTAMGRAFVPFSIEVGMDWVGIEQELAQLVVDGRDVLDSGQLYNGSGTDSPAGVRTGLAVGQRVQTDVAATLDIDDVYDLKGQLPARFIPNATFAAHPNKWDSVFRFTPSGSTTEPQAMPTREGPLIGRPKIEWTAIPTALTTGTTQMLYGDFRAGFYIADRLGMTVEVYPALFGGAGRRPTGERGFFAFWRTGSKTVVPEAFKYLETL